MNADEFNELYLVGTPVLAFPGVMEAGYLLTKTRSAAWKLPTGTSVVKVDDYAGGIVLSHIIVLAEFHDKVYNKGYEAGYDAGYKDGREDSE